MKLLTSTAHEVYQALPLSSQEFVCAACNLRGPIELLFSQEPKNRCKPHFVTETSGWKHDPRFAQVTI